MNKQTKEANVDLEGYIASKYIKEAKLKVTHLSIKMSNTVITSVGLALTTGW